MVYQPLVDASSKRGASVETIRSLLQEAPFAETHGLELMKTVRDAMGWPPYSPLSSWERRATPSAEVLRALIMHDPECTRVRVPCGLLLHYACRCSAPHDVIQLLVELHPGAVREFDNDHCRTLPLHYACCSTALATVELLANLYPGAIQIRNSGGEIPLHYACRSTDRSDPVVQFLIKEYPEGVRTLSYGGCLPLHIACVGQKGSIPRAIHLLIELHPEGVTTQSRDGLLPLHEAAHGSSPELVRLLLKLNRAGAFIPAYRSRVLPLHVACVHGDIEKVRLLLDVYPGAVRWQNRDGELPIHYACQAAVRLDVLQLLVDYYPESLRVANKKGKIPLHVACEFYDDYHTRAGGGFEQFRFLVEAYRFSVIRETRKGRSPLQLAHSYPDRELARLYPERPTNRIMEFLREQHAIVVEVLREAYELVVSEPLGLPELVEETIWGYAEPRPWDPSAGALESDSSDEDMESSEESDSDGDEDMESGSDEDENMGPNEDSD